MSPELEALGDRAVACAAWHWMPGMHVHSKLTEFRYDGAKLKDPTWIGCVPDLSDPATIGCLLALVREALGDPEAYCIPTCRPQPRGWELRSGPTEAWGETEAEALVLALEHAEQVMEDK